MVEVAIKLVRDLKSLPRDGSAPEWQAFGNLCRPLLELSKCPDYVVNRGHYFGATLRATTTSKALIEFLKTF